MVPSNLAILALASPSCRSALAINSSHGYVPFKSVHVGNSDSPRWNRLYHFFHMNRAEFLQQYHQRSNAESAFSSMKRKFADTVRSKTEVAQTNEVLLKVLCHNIVCLIHEMHETGAPVAFPA